jgi:type IV pilus assembly protein PilB
MEHYIPKKIKEYLIDSAIISKDKMDDYDKRDAKGKSWEDDFLSDKVLTSEQILNAKSRAFNLPAADLSIIEISPEALNILSQKAAENYQMIVFEKGAGQIKIGLVNPDNFQAHEAADFLAKQQGMMASYYVITNSDFKKAVNSYSEFKKEIGTALQSAEAKFAQKEVLEGSSKDTDLSQQIKTAPVAKIVSVIIEHAADGGASDIHIEPGRTESRVRYRVDGILHTSISLPNYLHSAVVSRIKVMANLKLDETRTPQDGRIRMELNGRDVDLRVSVLPMLGAEKIVIRVLDTSKGVPSLAELGFSSHHIEIINRNVTKPFGLFLLTGPTGSGKATTLYSILNILNTENSNITTLEDPIEYYINGINQSQINTEIGFTFANGLRAILRQDPNIIMVGEIRDNETAELVVHAALTGHLVFSTLHTNDAWGAVPRLSDMQVESFLLSSIFNLVMAQRLVRKICADCKTEIKLPPDLEQKIREEIKDIPEALLNDLPKEIKFFKGKGCPNCNNSGYVGRSVLSEILEITPPLKDLIAKRSEMEAVRVQLKKQNFINLRQDGIIKALKGVTTLEEVIRASQEQET